MTAPDPRTGPQPLLALPVPVTTTPGRSIDAGDFYLAGWSFRESTGTASAQFDLIDGNDATGVLLASISLAAGESTRDTIGGHLLTIRTGLFLAVVSGSVIGAVWTADRDAAARHRPRRNGA